MSDPHCGHGSPVDDWGDQAPDCPYCAEDIDPDDYWDMVRFANRWRRKRPAFVPWEPKA